ncbi:MAG: hypothetical protein C4522_14045 [Desulfobacteraceae bacterium]|nr:MAG: hypothetical protein C4522_14045 [Desulfobacteraceae bacterium]
MNNAETIFPDHGTAPANEQQEDVVYLCQVSETVSCGACCGLYNLAGLTKDSLETILVQRTTAFERVPRTIEGIDGFWKKTEGWTPAERPFPHFHHCVFLGMVGKSKQRVGCLLHPAASGNNGIDWRGLSYYGGMACRTYFCPSYQHLPPRYLKILKQTVNHWFPFGLMVTEFRLLTALFEALENKAGRQITPDDFLQSPQAADRLRELLEIKTNWPFRSASSPGPCHYMFENGEYQRPTAQRTHPDIPLSTYETIFMELESEFASKHDLRTAEAILDKLFSEITAAIQPR